MSQDIPGREGWQTEANNKPKRSQSIIKGRTFQDEGPSPVVGSSLLVSVVYEYSWCCREAKG